MAHGDFDQHKQYEKRRFNYRGVKFRVWMYFALFSFTLLTFMCAMQIIMFRGSYQQMKVTEMSRIVARLHEKYPASDAENAQFRLLLQDTALVNSIHVILVFRMDGEKLVPLCDSFVTGPGFGMAEELIEDATTAHTRLGAHDQVMFSLEADDRPTKMIFIQREAAADGGEFFYYLESAKSLNSSMTSVLGNQLMISIAVSALLSLLLSVFLSRSLAQPVTKLTQSARKLAAGDYNVVFETQGYGEFDELADTLNYATEEMKATDELRKDLIANISHELRTPLTMIKAYAEMIRDLSGDKPAKRAEHVQVILDETDRLSALVTDILDLSRLQADTEQLDKSVFDLSGLVREVFHRFEGMFAPKGYTLSLDVAGDYYIVADAKKIGQVVYNLIGNALNYVGDDKRIEVSLVQDGNELVFRVADHGKGIAADVIPHIWDRYFRSAEAKRTKVGSGIGLSIVKSVCEMHKLKYGVESELDKGSVFWVRFDRVEPSGV